MRTNEKRGFTMIELLMVVAILLLLIGAITTSVTGARRRAKIQQAIAEAQQLTDAILAYENFIKPGDDDARMPDTHGEWKPASEKDMAFVLGKVQNPNGQEGFVPVLFNGAVIGGSIRDPWGHPYQYRILAPSVDTEDQSNTDNDTVSALAVPNINRISVDEVN